MGKGTDLWDDSALVDAFDHAMSTYKAMHSGNYHGESPEEGTQTSEGKGEPSLTVETAGQIEERGIESTVSGENGANTGLAPDVFSNQEHLAANLHSPEARSYFPSESIPMCSDQQSEEYNQLLKQYYELEEQKQRVLQQLHQANYWNYQASDPHPTFQDQQAFAYKTSEHSLHNPASACLGDCASTTLSSTCPKQLPSGSYCCCAPLIACCSAPFVIPFPGGQCLPDDGVCPIAPKFALDPLKQPSCADDIVVKTGMAAAERAISSMKRPAASEGEQQGEEKESEGKVSVSVSMETDLNVVLNAWYAAGFHTGRYLSEQSMRKAHH